MDWQLLIFLRILTGNILFPIFFKKAADLPYQIKRQFWIYSFCFFLSLTYFLSAGKLNITAIFTIFVITGLASSLAFYFNLKAVNINQSRSSVLSILTDFTAIFLAFLFLKEYKYLSTNLILGLFLIIVSFLIFVYTSKNELKKPKIFFQYILGYSIIWGIIAVIMRAFAFNGFSFATFGLGWYFGSWLGTTIFLIIVASNQEKSYELSWSEKIGTFMVSFFIWISMLLGYFALKKVPLSVYEPFLIISQIIFPTLIGLFIFKEIKSVKALDIVAFVLAIISGIVIAFNY